MRTDRGRSARVTTTISTALRTAGRPDSVDFDALYRSSRDDLFAYVLTLLRDRASAEDVTALSFEQIGRASCRERVYSSV